MDDGAIDILNSPRGFFGHGSPWSVSHAGWKINIILETSSISGVKMHLIKTETARPESVLVHRFHGNFAKETTMAGESVPHVPIASAPKLDRAMRAKLDEMLMKLYAQLRDRNSVESVDAFRAMVADDAATNQLNPSERRYLERGIEDLEICFGLLPMRKRSHPAPQRSPDTTPMREANSFCAK